MIRLLAYILLFPAIVVHGQVIHEVTPLDLGTDVEDYSPVPVEGGFVMSSVREATGAIDMKDASTGKALADLYWVPFKNGVAFRPALFSTQLTTPVNEGPATFNSDGTEICYTRNLVVPKKLSSSRLANGQLGLFFSDRIGETWQAPVAFEHNSPKYAVMHPTFGPDGNTIYFTSDMPGGFGGFDLYSSTRSPEGWSAPRNLGPSVNGPAHEVFPRMQADRTLFFSSDRTGGLGRLDVYMTMLEGNSWNTPTHLPAPINSPANDVGYTLLADGFNGLMSSDRTGVDRIHLVKYTVEKFSDCTEQRIDNFCYSFKGKKHAATNNLPLEHVWDLGDGNRINGHSVNHCYSKPGTYEVRSMLVDQKTGAVFHVLAVKNVEVEQHVQAFIASPDTVRTGRQIEFDASLSNLPGTSVGEYHWDLGDGSAKRTPRLIHQYKAAGTYTVRLDILSTPDDAGNITNHCNIKKVVVIDRYREHEDQTVVAVYQDAFGVEREFEYQELPFDQMSMGLDENGEVSFSVELFATRERMSLDDSRFVEIRKLYTVVERYDPERGVYTYSVGDTKDLEELYEVFRKVKELDFLDAEVFALEVETLMDMSGLNLVALKDLDHSRLSTTAIHFASNSVTLDGDSRQAIGQVLDLLKQHPGLHVVIEAHTDDIGSSMANLELSQQRAASVVDHLKNNGISPDRMLPLGHGENQPLASNKTEAGRKQNRRVEFRLSVKEDLPSLVETR